MHEAGMRAQLVVSYGGVLKNLYIDVEIDDQSVEKEVSKKMEELFNGIREQGIDLLEIINEPNLLGVARWFLQRLDFPSVKSVRASEVPVSYAAYRRR